MIYYPDTQNIDNCREVPKICLSPISILSIGPVNKADPKLISVKSFSCKNDDVSISPTICVIIVLSSDLDNANSFYILLFIIL